MISHKLERYTLIRERIWLLMITNWLEVYSFVLPTITIPLHTDIDLTKTVNRVFGSLNVFHIKFRNIVTTRLEKTSVLQDDFHTLTN